MVGLMSLIAGSPLDVLTLQKYSIQQKFQMYCTTMQLNIHCLTYAIPFRIPFINENSSLYLLTTRIRFNVFTKDILLYFTNACVF